jgi:hypothetical protein
MGITSSAVQAFMAPLQQLMGGFAGTLFGRTSPRDRPAALRGASMRGLALAAVPPLVGGHSRPRRPVRVVRVAEPLHAPASAGRMVISGRMADVCAELDRMAALEVRGRAGSARSQVTAPAR